MESNNNTYGYRDKKSYLQVITYKIANYIVSP